MRLSASKDVATWHVIHGKPRVRLTVISDSVRREGVSFVPDKQDTIQLDRRTGLLSVSAQFPAELDFYRQEIGALYFGARDYFAPGDLLDVSALLDDLAFALSPEGVPGLEAVTLREVTLRTLGTGCVVKWKGPDLREELTAFLEQQDARRRAVAAATLALRVVGRKQPKLVTIEPPNKLTFDRRTHEALVREFLLARGLLRLPVSRLDVEQALR